MSFKKLVDATMKHGNVALTETAGGETNAYALSWWTKNLGYSRNAVNEADSWVNKDGKSQPYNDQQQDQIASLDRSRGGDQYDADYMTGGHDRNASDQYIAQQDSQHLDKRDPNDIAMNFDFDEAGGNYDPVTSKGQQVQTDWNAPDPADYVMTPDGRGVVVDSSQNNDGYYVNFVVELIDGENDGVKKRYNLRDIKKIPHNEMHPTEAKGEPQSGTERGREYQKSLKKDQNRKSPPDELMKYDTYGEPRASLGSQERAHRDALTRGKPHYESIRVNHPIHGNGIVEAITASHIQITWDNLEKRLSVSNTIPFAEAKYLTRLKEEYTDDVADAQVGNAKTNLKRVKKGIGKDMKKKNQKVDESMVAIGMAAIGGTHRGTTQTSYDDDDIIRFDDLLSEDDEWKQPWNEDEGDDTDDSAEGGEGSENHSPDQDTTKGADYTNVPRPADSVLTNQDNQQSYSADPLSTKAGFDSAGDGSEPDGDYQDINPVDAPETPQIRDLEGSSDRGNTRDTGGDSGDTSEVDAGDYDESKPEDTDGGENKMKNESTSAWLNADDLGINLMESENPQQQYDDYDRDMNEHEMGSGEIAFTGEFLAKLIAAVAAQAPDQATMDALCAGLESAQSEKGDAGLDVSDWDAVTAAASAAYGGGGDPVGAGDDADYDDEGGYDDETDGDAEFEDQAVGDGEIAGAEGGEEHEGKTKMMDCDGDDGMNEKKVDVDGKRPGRRNQDTRQQQSMKRRAPKKSQQLENTGTPIGTGSSSGSGGGNQTDLSKPKSYKGKPVGTGTSGAGGSNANEFGQKPTKDGGSNNVPEYESGNQLGAENTPFSNDAESPAPRSSKPLAAEGKKNSRKKIDEAICLGMSSIPGVIRGGHDNVPSDADWDDELKLIKRRAGMENWWKD